MKFLFVSILLSVFSSMLFSQRIINYSVDDGLPSNHIYDLEQDRDGYIWIATNRGVVKFNGSEFKIFTTKDGLPNNDIWSLVPDRFGKIWFLSKSNIHGYIENDIVHAFETEDGVVLSPTAYFIGEEQLWVPHDGFVYTPKDGIFKKQEIRSSMLILERSIKTVNHMQSMGFDLDEIYYFHNPESMELMVVNNNRVTFLNDDLEFQRDLESDFFDFSFSLSNDPLRTGLVSSDKCFFAKDDQILFLNLIDGSSKLHKFDNQEGRIMRVLHLDYCSEIQVCLENRVVRFHTNGEIIESIEVPDSFKGFFNFKDANGNLWMFDFITGVNFLSNNQANTEYNFLGEKVKNLEWVDDQLFVAVEDSGFYCFSTVENKFKLKIPVTKEGSYYTVRKDKIEDRYFFNTAQQTFVYEDQTYSKIIPLINRGELIHGFKDYVNNDYMNYGIAHSGFVTQLRNEAHKVTYLRKVGLTQIDFRDDVVYAGGADGLHQYKNEKLIRTELEHEYLQFPINFMKNEDEFMMVGTDGQGIYLIQDKKIIPLINTDGLIIQRIIKRDNNLWVATQNGVKKIALNWNDLQISPIVDAFYESDGLTQDNTNDIYIEGNVLFATSDQGMAEIDITNPSFSAPLHLKINSEQDTIVYTFSQDKQYSFSFQTIDYENQDHLIYEYRMNPLLKEWNSTDSRKISFNSLKPGLYTLEVKVNDHHLNQFIAKKHILIKPLWRQTFWAKLLFIILGILILILLIKFALHRIRNKEKFKEQEARRMINMELQALRSQMNPHFVHNSLNAIQYFIQRNEVDLSEEYLVKFAKLVRLFFDNSRKQFIPIKEEIDLLTNYLQIEHLRFEDDLEYSIYLDPKIDADEQVVPSMIIQPLVENAVNHGVFHKSGKGIVEIKFIAIDKHTFKVIVQDDGIGIIKAKELHQKSAKNYQSKSSMVIEERLELLRQSKEWDIEFKIKDRSELGEETGTIVSLILKYENKRNSH